MFTLGLIVIILLVFLFWKLNDLSCCSNEFLLRKRTLIITAHPDDETMFFAPVILTLLKQGCRVTVLCLSNGKQHSPQF